MQSVKSILKSKQWTKLSKNWKKHISKLVIVKCISRSCFIHMHSPFIDVCIAHTKYCFVSFIRMLIIRWVSMNLFFAGETVVVYHWIGHIITICNISYSPEEHFFANSMHSLCFLLFEITFLDCICEICCISSSTNIK